ncbi:MAG: hypothetical protein EBS84_20905, partial [Proteobacteria bacterium]|nr:hypothetical protein [Pseudomonadota bacterium]
NPYTPFTGTRTLGNRTETDATTVAVYASDTIKLGQQWEATIRLGCFGENGCVTATATPIRSRG